MKKAFKKLKKLVKKVVKGVTNAVKALVVKPLKKVLQNKVGRIVVAAVATYFTFGAVSSWVLPHLANVFAGAMTITTSQLAVVSTIGGVIAGSAAGFVGGAIMSGNLKGGIKGAFSGAVAGGIHSYFSLAHNANRFARGLSGGINGYLSRRDSEGFFRGFISGQSSIDLGMKSFYTNKFANLTINTARDYMQGYIIDGSRGGEA